ncbi:MAG: hypothetical protein KKE31_07880 [Planctomycetes bacterium]|nr:hypothetical protein [Planctomycetota bacterium]MBU1518085.1 hypothetical protein [Planctomycetota bacterium]MBU2458524.1 hypothetical protein [Planctomycetota bacterium]
MQKSRSQGLNRYYARKQLCELLENSLLGDKSRQAKKIAKIRKQKDRRKRRTVDKGMKSAKSVPPQFCQRAKLIVGVQKLKRTP